MNVKETRKNRRYVPNLSADLESCDANYIRFLRLFPNYQTVDGLAFAVSLGGREAEVDLSVTERCPYTTFVTISVEGGLDQLAWLFWPRLSIGLYHDLSTAEVLGIGDHQKLRQRYEMPNKALHHPDEKSQVNRALGELLAVCIEHGRAQDTVMVVDD
jgi:uncharacterized protein